MSDRIGRWGLYPWFLEHGQDKVHPQDLDGFQALGPAGPYGLVFQVADDVPPYVVLEYGAQRFRVMPELLREVEAPRFRIGDPVLVPGGALAVVREIHWHHKRGEPFFLLMVEDRRKSKRYWTSELLRP